MAYSPFNKDKPDGAANGTNTCTEIRTNMNALRDAVVSGMMKDWEYSKTDGTGTAEQPQYVFYKLKGGTLWIRQTLAWGSSGGSAGNVTSILVEFSSNSGGAYDAIGTLTIAYDASGNVTTATW